MEFFATCPAGFEPLLADEIRRLGASGVRPLRGQVAFGERMEDAYCVCMWSRLASRVVAVLGRVGAGDSNELYESLQTIPWDDHMRPNATFAIDASGGNAQLRTSQFVAVRTKDAIVDYVRERSGVRPSVDSKRPDLTVAVRISRNRATVGIDLVGSPLFSRGYNRLGRGLRPDYAAAMLALASWEQLADDARLLSVHDEQATLVVEAAMIRAHLAPGMHRMRWGFEGWAMHDETAWKRCVDGAHQQFNANPRAKLFTWASGNSSPKTMLRAAGIEADVQMLRRRDLSAADGCDLLACDLCGPGGEDIAQLANDVSNMMEAVTTVHPSKLVTFSRDAIPSIALHVDPRSSVHTMLGREEAQMSYFEESSTSDVARIQIPNKPDITPLVAASEQFAARLKKVARLRSRWARRNDITCYRVYDADLPDYAVTIDLFQETDPKTMALTGKRWLHLSEFAPPKEVDPALARCRLLDALSLSSAILDVDPSCVYTRVRRRDKGGSQYADEGRAYRQKQGGLPKGARLIEEGGLSFEVNFSSRLDCGIFLDHRETRSMLREMAKETKGSKRFLNLFAYTGTATCYAADGGMIHTTTVDLSRPSLDWAKRNMDRNGFTGREHEYVQADVLSWVQEQRHSRNRWDLVFCDVPTFSNSSRMRSRSFDVQRDHVELLIALSRLLTRNGTAVFSCNLRTFKPDVERLERAKVEISNITEQTIPEDFARNKRIHHAYIIRHARD